ncbi:hypothetical protein DFH05DRAFT_1529433 [Lentinula detonsa]|uniref:Uncharacterized protein n=1 Tax=Lentinula detonsa TaxID=2804962 RepID=A0A9W8TTN0_9AGAR|nr:hypothetical protein DFH05DRAFT_1529433 [Lentinula detonsa]KAJ3981476.1 hypothetical protein F5890DRAFT_1556783 [Lentinula detonsa]
MAILDDNLPGLQRIITKMFMFAQLARFALILFATTGALAGGIRSQKRSNDTTQCLNTRDSDSLMNRASPALSFDASQWIWTPELSGGNAPVGSRGFRKTFVPPQGKTPAFLTIAYSVDNVGTLFVNGQEISTEDVWYTAGTYCINLADCGCAVVIAFNVTNESTTPNPAGLLVAGIVTYTDGSTSPIVSDTTWRTSEGGLPTGFQDLTFDDSTWAPAVTEGANGVAPWGDVALAGSDPLSFTPARWIWTNEVSAGGNYPPGARAFRYTLTLPGGQTSGTATIIIDTDNEYSLYVNGAFVGTGTDFETAQKYVVENVQGPEIVFAVYAVNTNTVPNPAGLLAAIQVTSQDGYCTQCISTSSAVTFAGWKAFPGPVPSGFEQPGFDDSTWPTAADEGAYGVAPWGNVPVPTTVTTGGTPLPGAPGA